MTRQNLILDRRRAAVKDRAGRRTTKKGGGGPPLRRGPSKSIRPRLAEKTDEELLQSFTCPTRTDESGDDFSAFMALAIPEHLRRRALRKLWVV